MQLKEGEVSLQAWLPDQEHYEEVVRRNNAPDARWALITLTDGGEDDGRGAIPVHLG